MSKKICNCWVVDPLVNIVRGEQKFILVLQYLFQL